MHESSALDVCISSTGFLGLYFLGILTVIRKSFVFGKTVALKNGRADPPSSTKFDMTAPVVIDLPIKIVLNLTVYTVQNSSLDRKSVV